MKSRNDPTGLQQMSEISKTWYIRHSGILFSIKKNKVLIYATTWMNPQNIMLSEGSQAQRPHTL